MTDKSLKILLGIIAINLTIQTVRDVGLFPTAYAQLDNGIQKVAICDIESGGRSCASVVGVADGLPALHVIDIH
jgi:hypothetical protein